MNANKIFPYCQRLSRPLLFSSPTTLPVRRLVSHRASPVRISSYNPTNPTILSRPTVRSQTTSAVPAAPQASSEESARRPEEVAAYEISFTCKPCGHHSTHRISKHGYHKGSVLIICPDCSNRHVISDHLKIFSDKSITLEEILREKGETMQKGVRTPDGDFEFWSEDQTPKNSIAQ